MPPSVTPIPVPKGRGADVVPFLEANGIFPVEPPIHSSDLYELHVDPFNYYLKRRLGLVKALRWPGKALNRGSWFHTIFELAHLSPGDRAVRYEQKILNRLTELEGLCATLGLLGDKRTNILRIERQDARTAQGWFEEALTLKYPHIETLKDGFLAQLNAPHLRVLASELTLIYAGEEAVEGFPLAIIIDKLVYNTKTNTVWIYDPKTTGGDAVERAQCPLVEFQCRHYLWVVRALMQSGELQKMFGLPANATLGGMKHICVHKPQISFGDKDRDFVYTSEGKKTGISGKAMMEGTSGKWIVLTSNDGSPKTYADEGTAFQALWDLCGKKPEKLYAEGEPNILNYRKRVRDYYLMQGEYAKDGLTAPLRICISTSHAKELLDEDATFEYLSLLQRIHHFATLDPSPRNFARTMDGMWNWDDLTEYAPFYTTRPAQWPDVILKNGFIVRHRDEHPIPAPSR